MSKLDETYKYRKANELIFEFFAKHHSRIEIFFEDKLHHFRHIHILDTQGLQFNFSHSIQECSIKNKLNNFDRRYVEIIEACLEKIDVIIDEMETEINIIHSEMMEQPLIEYVEPGTEKFI
jgi:hypothetical protein